MMSYKKKYKQAVAARNAWRNRCLKSDEEAAHLKSELNQLKDNCDWLEEKYEKLRKKDSSTFDKAEFQRLKRENAELEEKLKVAEGKLSARTEADKTFKDNCYIGLASLGETVKKLNQQDEERKKREDFLLRAVEGLAGENLELKQQPDEKPGRAITIGEPRAEKETKQPEPKEKKKT